MRHMIGLALLAATLCGAAHAQEIVRVAPASAGDDITAPMALERPAASEIRGFFPEAAWVEPVGGVVELRCQQQDDGRLDACAIVSETPPDMGFGAASIALVQRYRFADFDASGASAVGRHINLFVDWPKPMTQDELPPNVIPVAPY